MNWFYNTVALLKEYRRLSSVAADLAMMAVVIICGAFIHDWTVVFFSVFPLTMILWEISDVYLYRERDTFKKQLADICDETVLLKGENTKLQEEVNRLCVITRDRKENPIKSNRIVSDKTFAVRLMNFAGSTQASDPASGEELEYLKMTAERLLKWQTKTVHKDSEEYRYLERLGLMPEPSANMEGHSVDAQKESRPKRRPACGKKTKSELKENENKD
jgi:hypothetical protein